MSERLTIDVVCAEDVWSNSYGEYQAYMLDVKTEDGRIVGNVSSNRKLKDDGSHFEPKEGEEVWGSLESKGGGKWKLTIDSQRMKAEPLGGSRPASRPSESSTGTKQSPKGETDWEVRNAEIRRQHSQEMALRALTKNATATGTKDVIKGWADWFDQDAIAAGQKASQGQSESREVATPDPVGNERTPGAPAAAPEKSPADVDLDDYRQLLDNAGLSLPAARDKVAEYMGVVLPPDRQKKATVGLQELERQQSVLAQLKTETEKWMGSSLPQGDALDADEDPVPF